MPPKKEPIIFDIDGFITQGKICTKCNMLKPFKDYYKCKQKTDGHQSLCIACKKEKDKAYYDANQDAVRDRVKAYYHEKMEDDAFVLSERKRSRRKYEKHGERYRKKIRERYRNDIQYNQKRKAEGKEWRENNKDKIVLRSLKRRVIKKKLPCDVYKEEWDLILDEFNHKCALTGESSNITVEHFIPLSTGHGGHIVGNVYPMTLRLNLSKSVYNPFEWVKRDDVLQEIDIEMWNSLINSLAEKNNLSVEDFQDYVYWCFNNQRKIEDITSTESSIKLWTKAKEG